MRPLLCCSVRRQGSWKCGNCVLTAGSRPIIHQEGSDSNANKCHNPVFNYIPSKILWQLLAMTKKTCISWYTSHKITVTVAINFQPSKTGHPELRWIFFSIKKNAVPSASLADALRVWELGETSLQSATNGALLRMFPQPWLKTHKYEMVCVYISKLVCVDINEYMILYVGLNKNDDTIKNTVLGILEVRVRICTAFKPHVYIYMHAIFVFEKYVVH